MRDRYELDDLEIVTLLNKTKEQRLNSEKKEAEVMVRCTKCRREDGAEGKAGFRILRPLRSAAIAIPF